MTDVEGASTCHSAIPRQVLLACPGKLRIRQGVGEPIAQCSFRVFSVPALISLTMNCEPDKSPFLPELLLVLVSPQEEAQSSSTSCAFRGHLADKLHRPKSLSRVSRIQSKAGSLAA